ncbi:hypothetical protein [Actinoplanes sp. NPDC051411]|uniref:hypothetical protein n=1 Tax=Actinoplanes sp. NPDC051411 TaxID=3155522 RepID=UPI00344606B8
MTIKLFRLAVTVVAILTFAQAVFAGSFLSGHFEMLGYHRTNSTITVAASAVMVVTAVLVWRPGRGPFWPTGVSVLYFAVLALQTFLGYRRSLAVHVPLGTAIIAGIVLLLVQAWKPSHR